MNFFTKKITFFVFSFILLIGQVEVVSAQNTATLNPDPAAFPLIIPDNDPAGILINLNAIPPEPIIPVGATVTDVSLDVDINHTWVGDLDMTLTSPDGTVISVFDRPGAPGTNFDLGCDQANIDVSFFDAAANDAVAFEGTCDPTPNAITGDFQSIDPFAPLNGESADGTWVLTIVDNGAGDSGGLAGASLNISYAPPPPCATTLVFINEIHYDNTGGDVGEFIEIAGTAGTDLTGYDIVLYNGNGGASYNTVALSGVIPDEGGGFGAISFSISGIQNGSPDGLALVDGGTVLEFLSYEGAFMATNGPANGTMSTDIGVSEPNNTPVGESLQLTGTGDDVSDFTWNAPAAESPGMLNAGQTVNCPPMTCMDNLPPVLSMACPANITLECSDPLPVPPVLMATDDCGFAGGGPDVAFINEFHYDNTGSDAGEFVEIAGTAGLDLAGYEIVLYNGNGGASYNTIPLSGVIPDEVGGAGAISFLISGIQNGSPDGIAFVDPGGVVLEFLSYEGAFMATNGPANGLMSTDVGVLEIGSTPVGESLQLTGIGTPGSFTWVGPLPASPGSINAGQTIDVGTNPGPIDVMAVDVFVAGACPSEGVITRTWTATDASGKSTSCSQLITLEDNTPPSFNEALPMDETTSCGVIPAAVTLTAADNCGGNVTPWVNEFHYDNTGADTGEFIEIAGFAGTNLTGYQLALYNGNGGAVGTILTLTGTIVDEGNGYGALSFAANGLMNGSPDGFAFVDPNGVVLEFLSYEGIFVGTSGPANGLTSTDVGVSEPGNTPIGQSLQLTGSGGMGPDFAWSGPSAESPGLLNVGQTITGSAIVVFSENTVGDCASGSTVTRTWTATDACGNATIHMQTITVVPDLPPVIDCPLSIFVHLDPGACDAFVNWNDPTVTDDCTAGVTVSQTGGPVSGSIFDRGTTTTITYTSSADDCGNTSTCSFNITIIEFVPTSDDLTCNDLVNITLDDETCSAVVGADQILDGNNYSCYDDYTVLFDGGPFDGQPVVLGPDNLGQTYNVQVVSPGGNSCWGSIFVEDKTIPDLECSDVTIACNVPTAPGTSFSNSSDEAFPQVATSTGTTTSTIDVNGFGDITDVNVEIFTDHTWVGDLVITVTSPSGTSVELLNRPGLASNPPFGCNNAAGDNMDIVMDDEATATYADFDGQCPAMGTFQSLQALSAFDGEPVNGTWTVEILDAVGGDDGNVDVTLNLSSAGSIPFPVPAGVTVLPAGEDTWTLLGFDPCGSATLTSSDSSDGDLCAGTSAITRTWTVTDGSGNSNTCTQTINITPITLADIIADLPADITLECGDPLPPVPTEIGCENIGIGMQGDPIIIDICEGSFKEIRNFLVIDWCTNETMEHQQIIKVLDTQGPTLTCPDDMTIGTTSNTCLGSLILPYPAWTDCGGGVTFTVTSSGGNVSGNILTNLPLGPHDVTYTGTDACGNTSTCSIVVTVEDNLLPTPVCDEITTVSIISDGTAYIDAATFDDGSHDNCGIVEMLARRMDNPLCAGNDATPFGLTVPFTCCDVNTTVMVEFQVTDEAGNTNSCMVEVYVEDKINPTITCPGSADLNCDVDYLDDILLGQPLPAAAIAANGEAIGADNCNATVTNNVIGKDIDCGAGTITIVWTATDDQGLTASCIQQYFVANGNPFYINPEDDNDPNDDVIWPADYTATTCGLGLEPADLSAPYNKPQIFEGACDNVAYGHWDVELTFGADDACLKILRKWYIIDWCQAQDNQDPTQEGPGVWHYTQVIKVVNSSAPTITCEFDADNNVIDNFEADCGNVSVTLTASAMDDCTDASLLEFTWALSNGATGVGNETNQSLPNGDYTITFTVNDLCGNESMCTRSFSIIDAKKPTPVCIFGIATTVMPSSGSVTIPVITFESGQSSDNCTIYENLNFSFSQDINDTELLINCDDVPPNGMVPVTLYVTDEEGNFDFCNTFIQVQDPNGICPDENAFITGFIENENQEAIQDVEVTLSDDNGMNIPVSTNSAGLFSFDMLYGDYDVTPEKDINYLNGVTTFDLVLISKHILGIEVLDSPYKWIAADANHSETITALDIVKLRALILHIDDELADNESWRFVDENFVFQNTNNPLAEDFPELIELSSSNTVPANFTAVKIGDVNGTAIPNQLLGTDTRNFNGNLALQLASEKVEEGETFTVDFRAKDFNNIAGYQFTFGFENVEFVDVKTNLEGLSTVNFGLTKLSEGVITTSWNSSKGVSVDNDEVLFTMTFIANNTLTTSEIFTINSRYTESEAYNGTDLFDVVLEFNGAKIANGFELYQNTPNPFKAETSIGFNVPQAGAITLKIMDVSGRVLRLIKMDAAKGFNSIKVDRASLDASGVLYYQLESATGTATKKMIIVD